MLVGKVERQTDRETDGQVGYQTDRQQTETIHKVGYHTRFGNSWLAR